MRIHWKKSELEEIRRILNSTSWPDGVTLEYKVSEAQKKALEPKRWKPIRGLSDLPSELLFQIAQDEAAKVVAADQARQEVERTRERQHQPRPEPTPAPVLPSQPSPVINEIRSLMGRIEQKLPILTQLEERLGGLGVIDKRVLDRLEERLALLSKLEILSRLEERLTMLNKLGVLDKLDERLAKLGQVDDRLSSMETCVMQVMESQNDVVIFQQTIVDALQGVVNVSTPTPKLMLKVKKLKVLVIGPNADQKQELMKRLGNLCDLTILHELRKTDLAKITNSDVCVGVTRFIDNNTEELLKKNAKKYLRSETVITGVVDALTPHLSH